MEEENKAWEREKTEKLLNPREKRGPNVVFHRENRFRLFQCDKKCIFSATAAAQLLPSVFPQNDVSFFPRLSSFHLFIMCSAIHFVKLHNTRYLKVENRSDIFLRTKSVPREHYYEAKDKGLKKRATRALPWRRGNITESRA